MTFSRPTCDDIEVSIKLTFMSQKIKENFIRQDPVPKSFFFDGRIRVDFTGIRKPGPEGELARIKTQA